ncbi:MAG: hypothetical protein EOO00_14905, partial [Chitinophagaceae bacterium]
YNGTVLANINLNDRGSAKETYHIEIAADGIEYKPGDSIGILPYNHLPVAEAIVSLTGIDREKNITHRTGEHSVFNLLQKKLNIAYLPERVVKQYSGIVKQEIPETKIGLLDLLKIYPVQDSQQFEEVISILEPITPRLYSISSSPEAHSGEVHITVAKDFFTINEELKYGLCSDHLSLLPVDCEIEFYVHKNNEFRLPEEDKDVIMIGPGTGIAPFRSMAHYLRDHKVPHQEIYLLFGCRTKADLLYYEELKQLSDEVPNFHYLPTLSREQWEGPTGYVHTLYENICRSNATIGEDGVPIPKTANFYLCGWKNMIDEARLRIQELGYDRKAIHQELYG